MRFYECNCNKPLGDYDAVARRKGAEPDFSYSDKIVIPKIFNLATNNKPAEKQDKPKRQIDTTNTAGITVSPTPAFKPSPKEKSFNRAVIPSKAVIGQVIEIKGDNNVAIGQIEKIKQIVIENNQSDSEKISAIALILGLIQDPMIIEEERKEDYIEKEPINENEQTSEII